MFLPFKRFIAISVLLFVPSKGRKFEPRRLLTTTQLSNGAVLGVNIHSPADGTNIPVDEGVCSANIEVSATAFVGAGEPDVTYIYVIDDSGSTSNIIDDIKTFFIDLTGAILSNVSTKNVGVVTFDSSATIQTGLTRTESTIINAINAATDDGGTQCGTGLNAAMQVASQPAVGNTVVVIFTGDGECFDVSAADPTLDTKEYYFNPTQAVAAADALAADGVTIQVLAIGSGVSCGSGSLGDLPRNGGSCQEIANIADFPISELVGTKLIEGETLGDLTTFNDNGFTAGVKEEDFTGSDVLDRGAGQTICARARGDDVLDEQPQDVEECITVNVIDDQDPTIDCPADITVGNDAGQCSAVVDYEAPVGEDNCPGAYTVQTQGLPSGATFEVADSPIENVFKVTDAEGAVASCGFTVTVEDQEAPAAFCTPSVNPAGKKPKAKNQDGFFELSGEDNCGAENLTLYVVDSVSGHKFGPFPGGTVFKYVEAPGAKIKQKRARGDVDWRLTGNGDAFVLATDMSGNVHTADCLVPPPPARHLRGD